MMLSKDFTNRHIRITVEFTVTFILPSLSGFFRAIQLSPFLYRPSQLLSLCKNIQSLLNDDTLDMVRVSITTCLKNAENNAYSRRVLAQYMEEDAPLSSNRIIHDLLIAFRNVLSRVLTHAAPDNSTAVPITLNSQQLSKMYLPCDIESIWSLLMENPSKKFNVTTEQGSYIDKSLVKNIKQLFIMSLGYHDDIRKFAEKSVQEGTKWAPDAYMQEIMGTSLVRIKKRNTKLVTHLSRSY